MRRPPVRRLVALLALMTMAFTAIFVRLTVLQVSQAASFRDRALEQRLRTVELPAVRGQILDRNGESLAISLEARDVYADPRYVQDPWATAAALAPLLEAETAELVELLTRDTTFVYLARQVDRDLADRIEELGLAGVGFLETSRRYYPAGSLGAQVLGFVGIDGEGLAGLEVRYEDLLAGKAGERTQEIDPYGQPIVGGVDVERPPVAGSAVQTTIDREFQFNAEQALAEAVQQNRARGGTVIVMDPSTGDVLAMASYPSFDPNDFEATERGTYRNRAVTDAFEPGSTNKVITAAAAVDRRAIGLRQELSVPWQMDVEEFTIHDAHEHGIQRMTIGDIIAESSNIGTVMVARRLGESAMAAYLTRFGLGRVTGVGFPGESAGILPPLYEWTDTSLATIAYGQGIAATPLQMAAVYATIANDGRWVAPRLVLGTRAPDGTFEPAPDPVTRRAVSASTAHTVTRMLAHAVAEGTGTNATIAGYQIAGKTGTARIPLPDRPGYYEGQYVASFIGFLPASDPQVVIAAILDRPVTDYGGIAAAPLFQRIARYAITRLSIEPGTPLRPPPTAGPRS
ncbi:MAG TPA: penicillin-binding protein 2 [Actinomycetota bacterium]|nr:penicillin-binding protein 2 [Actinomycetota bacterium]